MKINKCPKCGRKPSVILLVRKSSLGHEVECYDCGLHTGCCETHHKAIDKWNELTNETTKTK